MSHQSRLSAPVITGMGIMTAIGQGKAAFREALFAGKTEFGYLERAGRGESFIGAELSELPTDKLSPTHQRMLRTASLSAKVALMVTSEAWHDAGLDSSGALSVSKGGIDPLRIGLVVGGSNVQQRAQLQTQQRYETKPEFITPTYSMTLWDTDLVGILSQAFQIQGEGYSVGGASASGSMAIIHAARQIQLGITDVSLAVGALFDLSQWECQSFRNVGAMGSGRYANQPRLACRPFDQESDGFIYGEGCGVLVLERAEHAKARGAEILGQLLGWSSTLDGKRTTKPNQEGETRAIMAALRMAGLESQQIDYINPHGTGSPLGDRTEVAALKAAGLSHALINATKSLTGHCLTAAGVVEAIATLLQMDAGRCHPTHNLVNPIDPSLNWVRQAPIEARMNYALSNSFAFGGMNTALIFGQND